MDYRCAACSREEGGSALRWRCSCGGVWDLAGTLPRLEPPRWREGPWSVWRYRQALPFPSAWEGWRALTMGEGGTPLVHLEAGSGAGSRSVLAKLDFAMPTLSFKDRGAVMLIADAVRSGARAVVADSSGNAGAAVSAYAGRAGLAAEVFVPAGTSPRKIRLMEHYGATVHVVAGDRQAAADAAVEAVEAVDRTGCFYASHAYNPWFLQGTQTFAFEVWEQLGGRAPATVVLPAGNGTLVLGAAMGFARLRDDGFAPGTPRILAVQADNCAPLARAAARGEAEPARIEPRPTAAEGVAVAQPPRGAQVLAAVAASGGAWATVEESELADARAELGRRGISVEPTGALAWAAARARAGDLDPPVVVVLGGAGAKTD